MKARVKMIILIALLAISVYSLTSNGASRVIVTGDNVTVEYSAWTGHHSFKTSNITFIVGAEEVIKGLDNAVLGMRSGGVKNVTIPPAFAYGVYDDQQVYEIPNAFFENLSLPVPVPGAVVEIEGHVGRIILGTEDSVVFDLNHELAGKELNMTVRVLSING